MGTSITHNGPARGRSTPPRPFLTAMALLAVPAGVLLLFALGEIASGDISGVQHIPEAALLLGLMVAAWLFPQPVGAALMAIGSVLLMLWLAFILVSRPSGMDGAGILVWLGAGLILFAFPIAAGYLLFTRGHRTG